MGQSQIVRNRGNMGAGHALRRGLAARDFGPARRLAGFTLACLLFAALSGVLFSVEHIYRDAMRDPRFLDGWLLVGAMCLQLRLHIAATRGRLSPKASVRWRKLHIFIGYLLIPIFLLHSDFSLPDTFLEWALWTCFVTILLSGIFRAFVAAQLGSREGIGQGVGIDGIAAKQWRLVRDVHAIATAAHPAAGSNTLPMPPYDAWISELYVDHLKSHFGRQPRFFERLAGSRHRLKRVIDEIGHLSAHVDEPSQKKLAEIRTLVVEKDQLDAARVALGLSNGCLLVHVPASYMMVVLTVVHVLSAYAFSSGAW